MKARVRQHGGYQGRVSPTLGKYYPTFDSTPAGNIGPVMQNTLPVLTGAGVWNALWHDLRLNAFWRIAMRSLLLD